MVKNKEIRDRPKWMSPDVCVPYNIIWGLVPNIFINDIEDNME